MLPPTELRGQRRTVRVFFGFWLQAATPGSDTWNATIRELVELDFTLVPTLTIYEASRDLMRARLAEWHDEYTLPALWRFYEPNREKHASYGGKASF